MTEFENATILNADGVPLWTGVSGRLFTVDDMTLTGEFDNVVPPDTGELYCLIIPGDTSLLIYFDDPPRPTFHVSDPLAGCD